MPDFDWMPPPIAGYRPEARNNTVYGTQCSAEFEKAQCEKVQKTGCIPVGSEADQFSWVGQ
jgi:hypothetical protein